MKKYSLTKGVKKGIFTAITVLASFVAFSGFADVSIWALVEQYLKPLIGAMTVGGAITLIANWVKVKFYA